MNKPFTIWLTGIPGAGKSTIAREVAQALKDCFVIDSDIARAVVTPNPTYSPSERAIFYHSIVYTAQCLNSSGVSAIIAATGNLRSYRNHARLHLMRFVEVYVECSVQECARRDTKGLYEMALQGRISTLPLPVDDEATAGFPRTDVYEPPDQPDLVVNTERNDAATCVKKVIGHLRTLS